MEVASERGAFGRRRTAGGLLEKDGRAARMYAIARARDAPSRAEAARLTGMERHALRDAVLRYNAEGLSGLREPPGRLTLEEEPEPAAVILRGLDPVEDGGSASFPANTRVGNKGRVFASGSAASARPRSRSSWRSTAPAGT